MTMEGDEPYQFDWSGLVPQVVHPLRVAIVEALDWINQPLSPSEFRDVFEQEFGLPTIAYHVNKLAEAGAIVEVGTQSVRGATQTFFFFTKPR